MGQTSTLLTTLSLSCFWVLSPDALILNGQQTGRAGGYFLIALLLAAFVIFLSSRALHVPVRLSATGTKKGPGRLLPIARLAAYLSCTLFLSAGMLVSAGYSFNETFVVWFPNFGFAFLLLGLIILLHLALPRYVNHVQVWLTAAALVCLLSVIGAALLSSPVTPESSTGEAPTLLTTLPVALLLFLGYEKQGRNDHHPSSPLWGISLVVLFSIALSLAFSRHLPADRLADSTIPHLRLARAVMGDPGRMLMSGAVIFGTAAFVNAMLQLVRHHLLRALPELQLPRWFRGLSFLALPLAIASCLLSGLAGELLLETLIFSSLLLWLLSSALTTLAAGSRLRPAGQGKVAVFAVGTVQLVATVIFTLTHSTPVPLLGYALLFLAVTAVLLVLLTRALKPWLALH